MPNAMTRIWKTSRFPSPANLFNPPAGSGASRHMGSGVGRTHSPWGLAKRLDIPTNLNDREYAKEGYQKYLKRYLRCVKGVDDNVKRLVDYLKETGELNNTVIMYTGDQGFFLGEHDLMDKRWMYEESMRMPFIVHWPKEVKKGSSNDWLINNTDFAPTILDIAGVKTPGTMQGRSYGGRTHRRRQAQRLAQGHVLPLLDAHGPQTCGACPFWCA